MDEQQPSSLAREVGRLTAETSDLRGDLSRLTDQVDEHSDRLTKIDIAWRVAKILVGTAVGAVTIGLAVVAAWPVIAEWFPS